ncbi:MAG: 4'-phosphopantetheinyl transferase superfamily protein [Desulfobulbaceae bacterium]|nr:MAG: 4'-phosphopantetheinyl transferase superfamily protein [Desulfobulbaceae bacterium]
MITLPEPTLRRIEKTLVAVFPNHPVAAVLSTVIQPDAPPSPGQRLYPGSITLAASEWAALAAFSLPKRRAQWYTGRLCAKQAVARYMREHLPQLPLPDSRGIVIGNLPSGRPYIETRLAGLSGLDLSISHSGDLAAAIVSTAACGIDIQVDTPSLELVSERFCRESERQLLLELPGGDYAACLNMLWTAKEAAKKAARDGRMPGFLELVISRPSPAGEGCILWSARHDDDTLHRLPVTNILTTRFGQYAFSIALVPGESSHA